MDDLVLETTLGDSSKLYVTPLDNSTYCAKLEHDTLGGGDGYFLVRETASTFEILAKAASFEAASTLFDLISMSRQFSQQYHSSAKVY